MSDRELETNVLNIVLHYYYYYEKLISVVYYPNQLLGESCENLPDECVTWCAALDLEALKTIATSLLNVKDGQVENVVKHFNYLCEKGKVKKPLVPVDEYYSPALVLCRLLIPALFTPKYNDDKQSLVSLINVLQGNSEDTYLLLDMIDGKIINEPKGDALFLFEQCSSLRDDRDRNSEHQLRQILKPKDDISKKAKRRKNKTDFEFE